MPKFRALHPGCWFLSALALTTACASDADTDDVSDAAGGSIARGGGAGAGGSSSAQGGGAGKGAGNAGATNAGSSGGGKGGTGAMAGAGGTGNSAGTGGSSTGVGGATAGSGGASGGTAGSTASGGDGNASGGTPASAGTSGDAGNDGAGGSAGLGGAGSGGTGGMNGAGTAGVGGGGSGSGGKGGSAGTSGSGSGGKGGTGGATGTAGKGGSGGGTSSSCTAWPAATGSQNVPTTIQVSGTYDGTLKRFVGTGELGTSGQDEDQGPLFQLADGATLKNVVLGNPAADGIHCAGACTLENVWWEDVGEDAATFRGSSSSQQMTVRCGGAKNASDKVFQHNGAGTLTISNFTAETFGKLYRSCGNCSSQYARHVVLSDVTARSGSALVGINTNYGDTADFERITVYGSLSICDRYTGNSSGDEPTKTGSGSDSQYCRYTASDITQR